jgi:hypothetical protein
MRGPEKMDASRYVLPGLCLVLASCAAAPTESPAPSHANMPPSSSTAAPVAPTADAAPFKSAPSPVPQVTQSAPTPAEAPASAEVSPDSSAESAAAASPPATTTQDTATPAAVKPTPKATVSKPKSTTAAKAAPAATAPGAIAAAKPAAAPALDLTALEQRLRDTKAIGLFTKLSIKNQVDDLLSDFRAHFKGQTPPLTTLRQRYDLLLMKVLSSVQDGDPPLANAIASSREAIWKLLNDPANLTSV